MNKDSIEREMLICLCLSLLPTEDFWDIGTGKLYTHFFTILLTNVCIIFLSPRFIFSELLLKEVSSLLVDASMFEITYVDGTTANYNYTTDSSGRITGIDKVEEG
ncbi:hypothetical protein [Sutcliffiella sp. NC1]|uniref:hypothetical protein n=1 Tax=Sutcliffiella sp. NC1 TaxID=3004096 RepID=UPI0022DD6F25|nr:hypothetical protein [Sutcliffiella sp. NC1]WBL14812.1 hypothetical protein O1A01_23570 [Sutcliffiella sp. NC1]